MSTHPDFKLQAFYDGACRVCHLEIQMLRRWDRKHAIRFTDISTPDFKAADYGKTQEELMFHMHARFPDGRWITGVEVFRQLYSQVGFGAPMFFTRLPIIRNLLDLGYMGFAHIRPWLPKRRCSGDSCQL